MPPFFIVLQDVKLNPQKHPRKYTVTDQYLQIEREDGVAILILNRPDKRNALSPSALEELCRALATEDQNPQTRIIVITGAGETAFCAGGDLSEIRNAGESMKPAEGDQLIENAYRQIRQVSKPVIAMINGVSIGAGCDLITNCDFRFAAEEAVFAIPPARLGFLYSWEGMRRFVRLVGPANAKDLFMTGRSVTAKEAYDMGLINKVAPKARLRDETLAYARQLISAAPLSVWGAKRVIDLMENGARPSPEDMETIEKIQVRVWQSSDAKEGVLAFMEKRWPVFQGR